MSAGTATIRPNDHEWLALRDGVGHAQPPHGRERTACGEPRIDPRFAHPIRVRCEPCLDKVGITVPMRGVAMRGDNVEPVAPGQITGPWSGEATPDWAPGELTEAYGK